MGAFVILACTRRPSATNVWPEEAIVSGAIWSISTRLNSARLGSAVEWATSSQPNLQYHVQVNALHRHPSWPVTQQSSRAST